MNEEDEWLRAAPSNNDMHPTRDTNDFIYLRLVGGRVMPGVRRFGNCLHRREDKDD